MADISLTIGVDTLIGDSATRLAALGKGLAEVSMRWADLGDKMADARRISGLTQQGLEALRQATAGEIEDLRLLQTTAGLTTRGLQASNEQLAAMARFAKQAEEAGGSFEGTMEALGRAAISGGRGLKRFGIDSEGVTNQAQALERIVAAANERVAEAGEAADTAGDLIEQMAVSWANFEADASEAFTTNEDLVRSITDLREALGGADVEAEDLGNTMAEFAAEALDAINPLVVLFSEIWGWIVRIGEEVQATADRINDAFSGIPGFRGIGDIATAPASLFSGAAALSRRLAAQRQERESRPLGEGDEGFVGPPTLRPGRGGRPGGGGGGRSERGSDMVFTEEEAAFGLAHSEVYNVIDFDTERLSILRAKREAELEELMASDADFMDEMRSIAGGDRIEKLERDQELEFALAEERGDDLLQLKAEQLEAERELINASLLTEEEKVQRLHEISIEEAQIRHAAADARKKQMQEELRLAGQWMNAFGQAAMAIAGAAGLGRAEMLYMEAFFHSVQATVAGLTGNAFVAFQEGAAAAAALIGAQTLESRSRRAGARGSTGGGSASAGAGGGGGGGGGGTGSGGGGLGSGGGGRGPTTYNFYGPVFDEKGLRRAMRQAVIDEADSGNELPDRVIRRAA